MSRAVKFFSLSIFLILFSSPVLALDIENKLVCNLDLKQVNELEADNFLKKNKESMIHFFHSRKEENPEYKDLMQVYVEKLSHDDMNVEEQMDFFSDLGMRELEKLNSAAIYHAVKKEAMELMDAVDAGVSFCNKYEELKQKECNSWGLVFLVKNFRTKNKTWCERRHPVLNGMESICDDFKKISEVSYSPSEKASKEEGIAMRASGFDDFSERVSALYGKQRNEKFYEKMDETYEAGVGRQLGEALGMIFSEAGAIRYAPGGDKKAKQFLANKANLQSACNNQDTQSLLTETEGSSCIECDKK